MDLWRAAGIKPTVFGLFRAAESRNHKEIAGFLLVSEIFEHKVGIFVNTALLETIRIIIKPHHRPMKMVWNIRVCPKGKGKSNGVQIRVL